MKNLFARAGTVAAIAYGILGFSDSASAQGSPFFAVADPGWQGLYAGVNGGAGWGDSPTSITTSSTFENTAGLSAIGQTYGPTAIAGANASVSVGGTHFIGGGQAGYNFPFAARWVAGLEADIDVREGKNSITQNNTLTRPGFPGLFVNSGITVIKKLGYFATIRPRLGFLIQPATLPV